MVEIKENVNIKDYSTFKIGGQFRYFTNIKSIEDLESFYNVTQSEEKYKNIPLFILGGGSNIVFSDGVVNVRALKMEIKGFEIVNETNAYVDIKVGAGENWDQFVEKTVNMDLCGIESLSLIPGTVGATPVQNVGAYGAEVKDTIIEVEVFDIENGSIKSISTDECHFGYRDSVFKNEYRGKYIITTVTFRLSRSLPKIPKYPGVMKYFEDRDILNPTLREIRNAIIYIRNEKLPNPNEVPNAGSFFKNPIVKKFIADKIIENYPEVKVFQVDDEYVKIPAGWLIEQAGLKGKNFGNISVYDKNALVLVNNGKATQSDLLRAKDEIIKTVESKFGIILEQEPEIL